MSKKHWNTPRKVENPYDASLIGLVWLISGRGQLGRPLRFSPKKPGDTFLGGSVNVGWVIYRKSNFFKD